jgi:hypothetical protein
MICLLLLSNITHDPSYDPFASVGTAVDPKPKTVAMIGIYRKYMVAVAAFGKAVDFKSIVVATALDLTMLLLLVF